MSDFIRNAVFTEFGDIDCEVNHPDYGWIKYSIPKDSGIETQGLFLLAAQQAIPYSADPAVALEVLRQRKIVEINAQYVEAITPLICDYPEVEQATWLAQEREARAYLEWEEFDVENESAPPTLVLDNILIGRNGEYGTETMQQLCLAVLENADLFATAQQLTGKRQRLVKGARKAERVEDIELIEW